MLESVFLSHSGGRWHRNKPGEDMQQSVQARLSWITILRKREGYRKTFCNFNADLFSRRETDYQHFGICSSWPQIFSEGKRKSQ